MNKSRVELGLVESALLFAALGDTTRLGLIKHLSQGGPASITTLAENFHVTRQAVTKHLQFLSGAGIIDGTREGREQIWSLNPDRLADARRSLKLIAQGWDDALSRLKAHLEE